MRPVLEVCETRRDGVNFRGAWDDARGLRVVSRPGAVRHPSVSDLTAFFPGKTKRVASPLGPADGVRTERDPRGDEVTTGHREQRCAYLGISLAGKSRAQTRVPVRAVRMPR